MPQKYFVRSLRTGFALWALMVIAACDRNSAATAVPETVALSIGGVGASALENLPPGVTRDDIELGRQAYETCSVCHGTDGGGTALGPSLRDTTWIHIDGSAAQIVDIIRSGVSEPAEYPVPMPVMGGGDFEAGELRALAEYVHLLGRG